MPAPPKAGSELDRKIAAEIFHRADLDPLPPYSTDDAAADQVIAELRNAQLRCEVQEIDGRWLCVWWVKIVGKRSDESERLSTSTARTRALAICRSALALPALRRSKGNPPPSR